MQRLAGCALTRIAGHDPTDVEIAADNPDEKWGTSSWVRDGVILWGAYPDPMYALRQFYREGQHNDAWYRIAPCIDPIQRCLPFAVPELVRNMAQTAYNEHVIDSDRLRIMWDALEDAGIDEPLMRDHLLSNAGHWRGCWALEMLRNGR